jgi:catechol 2,3-dioxygenase-like lactoylglutathione lyase family enzyme
MKSVSISIDVPDIEAGIEFFTKGLGFVGPRKGPYNSVLLHAGELNICLLQKENGSIAVPATNISRTYTRHWTPVHLDIEVDDLSKALERAIRAGARQEGETYTDEQFSIAFCSDPFGNGFCLGEERARE